MARKINITADDIPQFKFIQDTFNSLPKYLREYAVSGRVNPINSLVEITYTTNNDDYFGIVPPSDTTLIRIFPDRVMLFTKSIQLIFPMSKQKNTTMSYDFDVQGINKKQKTDNDE